MMAGCALPVKQIALDTPLQPAAGAAFKLNAEASCSIGTGYSRDLRVGTRWNLVGRIAQGDVYHTTDQVITAEGYNVHEADLVVQADVAVGLYLIVERTYTPFSKPVVLSIERFQP